MKQNLDTLRDEVREYLEQNGFLVFHCYSRVLESEQVVSWNSGMFPDFRRFLDIAKRLDIVLIDFYQEQLVGDLIERAIEDLEGATLMDREEKRTCERRLKEYRMYEGFTCALELAFDHGGRMYLFSLRTDWYDEITDILNEIDGATRDDRDSGEEGGGSVGGGGYYSRN